MKVIKTAKEFLSLRNNYIKSNQSVGFVPTMGALHKGHISLVKRSKLENDITVVSIFVNPVQFNNKKDYQTYPRIIGNDIETLQYENVDVLFLPEEKEIYPEKPDIVMEIPTLTKHLCGATREGHFSGVLLVVSKLFNIISPDRAYFGKKDYQQLSVVKKMVLDLSFNIEIIGCEIMRETSGLAMSSRNTHLSEKEKEKASTIHASLKKTVELYNKGEKDVSKLLEQCKRSLEEGGIKSIDYVEVCDKITLRKIRSANNNSIILVAVFIGNTRLIDNLEF
ncbi:MAG: pantoate--beta-alanine ligase [Nitrospinae bacterium]|nr:pantoate--beta-alanine ligase [Nitrospinota bacterium]